MRIFSSRFFIITISVILIVGLLLVPSRMFVVVRAEAFQLYATTCLGGWENTHLATGMPEVRQGAAEEKMREEELLADLEKVEVYIGKEIWDIEKAERRG